MLPMRRTTDYSREQVRGGKGEGIVLVALLVTWVIAIPALTVIGAYLASRILGRRRTPADSTLAPLGLVAEQIDPCSGHARRLPARLHMRPRRSSDHALAGR
jgi:hypothetical protein